MHRYLSAKAGMICAGRVESSRLGLEAENGGAKGGD